MDEPGLKECPFCGSSAEILRFGHGIVTNVKPIISVRCKNTSCHCRTGSSSTVEGAIAKWHRRTRSNSRR